MDNQSLFSRLFPTTKILGGKLSPAPLVHPWIVPNRVKNSTSNLQPRVLYLSGRKPPGLVFCQKQSRLSVPVLRPNCNNDFVADNLERALFERNPLSSEEVSVPYRLNKPFIEGNSNSKIAINMKPGKTCMNWLAFDPVVEFIQTKTGKTTSDEPSRLCKRSLLEKFIQFLTEFCRLNNLPYFTAATYRKYKDEAFEYQQLKKTFLAKLEADGKGKWLKKPKDVDAFSLKEPEENELLTW